MKTLRLVILGVGGFVVGGTIRNGWDAVAAVAAVVVIVVGIIHMRIAYRDYRQMRT